MNLGRNEHVSNAHKESNSGETISCNDVVFIKEPDACDKSAASGVRQRGNVRKVEFGTNRPDNAGNGNCQMQQQKQHPQSESLFWVLVVAISVTLFIAIPAFTILWTHTDAHGSTFDDAEL